VVATTVAFPSDVEPARREWALAGTEDAAPALAAGPPRIRTPVGGARFALDPDMPPDRQRLRFEAAGATAGLRWRCDGRDGGAADASRLWAPTPGRHTLELVDAAGAVRDRVAFEVRGAVLPAPACSRSCGITGETARPGHARAPMGEDPGGARLPVLAAFRH
jgi:penicillin-binding protein 1C